MPASVDLYFSFRSPYSYLAAQGLKDLERDYAVAIHLRPVLPLAIREPSFFRSDNLDRVRYILMDYPRRAEMLGLPQVWPNPDPVVQDLASFSIADDQPYIFRLTRLGVEAQRQGRGAAFAAAVSLLLFGSGERWTEGEHLANTLDSIGLDLAAMEGSVAAGEDHDAEIEANQQAQLAAGHRGVPLFVYNGEPFFGQDRMETLCWRLGLDGHRR